MQIISTNKMKKKLLLLLFLAAAFFADAQNVGINTTSPQASLDVKGTERVGGINNYIKYDSATGRIEWNGASIFAPVSQQIIRHSASSEGLYAGGGRLEYREDHGNPVFFSDWTNGNGYFSGHLGIGIVSPGTNAKLQIRDGVSGITPFSTARVVVETNNHTYVNLLAPDPFETGILFGSGATAVSGLISYNSTTVPKGFIFNNNGNQTRMVINNAGNVGIGVTDPQQTLSIKAGMNIDQTNLNRGTIDNNVLRFGGLSGEAIGSARISGDNVYGLDFYAGGLKRMVIANGGNIGIGTSTPQYPLDINGRMRLNGTNPNDPGIWLNDAGVDRAFIGLQNDNSHVGFYSPAGIGWGFTMNTGTGALAVNGSEGANGKVLASSGGAANNWVSPTNTLFNNSTSITNSTSLILSSSSPTTVLPGMTYSFSSAGNSKVLIAFYTGINTTFCDFCGASTIYLNVFVDGAQTSTLAYDIANDVSFTLSNTTMITVAAGTHTIDLRATISGGPSVNFYGSRNLTILVIPE